MTPEEQRIAIAEACGWKWGKHQWSEEHWQRPDGIADPSLPDYLNDLNDCHAMEKALFSTGKTDMLNINYWNALWEVCNDPYKKLTTIGHATAPQRAEAFLKTILKWKD